MSKNNKELEGTIVLVLLQHKDRAIVERTAQILQDSLGEQFVVHGVEQSNNGPKEIETARCVLALRPEDINKTKASRWSKFDLARNKKG